MRAKTSKWIIAAALIAAIASPIRIAAQLDQKNQEHQSSKKHHRYVLKDLGTFGGSSSYVSSLPLETLLTDRGTVVGFADTSVIEPFSPNINDGPYAEHAFVWKEGALTDLGVLPKGFTSAASSINDHGTIIGVSENGEIDPLTGFPQLDAVLWSRGRIINLGTLGGNQSNANGINNRDQIVGGALNAISDPFANDFSLNFLFIPAMTQVHAFFWQEGRMHDLGTLGGPDSIAEFINDRGQVVGESYTDSTPNPATGLPTLHPFFWENGRMIDVGTLGGAFGVADALNNLGQIVGGMDTAGDQKFHPFLWDRGSLTDLGTLGGDNGEALWISDRAEVIGEADLPGSQVHHAFLWKHGVMTDLGTPDGDPCSTAHHVNLKGQVVGQSGPCGVGGHAFLWENGGPVVDLSTLVLPGSNLQLLNAFFINDAGEIVCRGKLANGDRHVCLLIPTHDEVDAAEITLVSPSREPTFSAPETADPRDRIHGRRRRAQN